LKTTQIMDLIFYLRYEYFKKLVATALKDIAMFFNIIQCLDHRELWQPSTNIDWDTEDRKVNKEFTFENFMLIHWRNQTFFSVFTLKHSIRITDYWLGPANINVLTMRIFQTRFQPLYGISMQIGLNRLTW